jgi:hypothetical protein
VRVKCAIFDLNFKNFAGGETPGPPLRRSASRAQLSLFGALVTSATLRNPYCNSLPPPMVLGMKILVYRKI